MRQLTKKTTIAIKLTISAVWLILFGLLLSRDVFIDTLNPSERQALRLAEYEEYQSIYFRGSKIGYVSNSYNPQQGNETVLEQKALMNLNIADTIHTIELHLLATISGSNNLKSFDFSFRSPFYQMQAKGKVTGNAIDYTLFTGSDTIRDSLVFDTPPMLSTSRRGYLLQSGMTVGDKRKIPWFDPVSLTGKYSVIEYRGKESVLINGRVQNLHRFNEVAAGARVSFWLNDVGIVIKEESPAGFVFIREPKFKALKLDSRSEEILSAVAVKVKGTMPKVVGDSIRYRLQLPPDTDFDLNRDRQKYNGDILTLRLETIPPPPFNRCRTSGQSLKPTPYVQAKHPDITALSSAITATSSSRLVQARKISRWVFSNLEKRPVLGLPDALTTLKSKKGDCNEHAALFAALARAAGIPTRIVAGVMYYRKAFYYHAWNEICLADQWISIDTTTNQFPADLTHIKFIQGKLKEQVRIGALLGNLAIEILPQTKQ